MALEMKICKLNPAAILPTYATPGSAGADLYALPEGEPVVIGPGETAFLHTGLAAAIPAGYVGLVFARSGLACKGGLAPANKVGVIDSDYRGEWLVALHNHGGAPQTVKPGDRIAQFVLVPVLTPLLTEVDALDETDRGRGGFGSTGR
jgi:dUTP pyrophosphatase